MHVVNMSHILPVPNKFTLAYLCVCEVYVSTDVVLSNALRKVGQLNPYFMFFIHELHALLGTAPRKMREREREREMMREREGERDDATASLPGEEIPSIAPVFDPCN